MQKLPHMLEKAIRVKDNRWLNPYEERGGDLLIPRLHALKRHANNHSLMPQT